jgi:carbonic anhydrase
LGKASRKNASLQAAVLRDTSPVLGDLVKEKKLVIRAAMYDVRSGKAAMIEN